MSEPTPPRAAPTAPDDPRPRPAYGEYATAEEQRARIQRPDVTWMLETGQDPDEPAKTPHGVVQADDPTPPARATGERPGAAEPASPGGAKAPSPRARFADRVATIALLVYGLVNVVTSVPAMIDYEGYVATVLSLLGVDGQLADPSSGRACGLAAALLLAIGWLLTALLSWRSLVQGRLTWWIPLVAGIVFTVVAGTLLMVPIVTDPALWQSVLSSTAP